MTLNSKAEATILAAIFTVLTSFMTMTTGEIQHIRFYSTSSSCNSLPNRTIHESLNNVNGSSFSSMSLLGMWQIWSCSSSNFNCGSIVATYVINYNPTTPFCVGRVPNVLYNFRMMGDPHQTAPELYLYSSKEFSGQVLKITNFAFWNSPSDSTPFSVQSFWFTGRHEWALFSEMSFKGTKTCLKPSAQVGRQGWGFSYNTTASTGINIKSAKCGCGNGASKKCPGREHLIVLLLSAVLFYSFLGFNDKCI